MCMYVRTYVRMYVGMYVGMHVGMDVCVCIHAYTRAGDPSSPPTAQRSRARPQARVSVEVGRGVISTRVRALAYTYVRIRTNEHACAPAGCRLLPQLTHPAFRQSELILTYVEV